MFLQLFPFKYLLFRLPFACILNCLILFSKSLILLFQLFYSGLCFSVSSFYVSVLKITDCFFPTRCLFGAESHPIFLFHLIYFSFLAFPFGYISYISFILMFSSSFLSIWRKFTIVVLKLLSANSISVHLGIFPLVGFSPEYDLFILCFFAHLVGFYSVWIFWAPYFNLILLRYSFRLFGIK